MSDKSRKLVGLITTIVVFLLISALSIQYSVYHLNAGTKEQQVNIIRKNVWQKIDIIERESEIIRNFIDTLPDSPNYSAFQKKLKIPYYVYRNGELVYWSDYRQVPDYSAIAGNYHFKSFTLKNGKHLVHRIAFDHSGGLMEVYSLLPLTKRYRVENDYIQSGLNEEIIPYQTVQISTDPSEYERNIYSPTGTFLFSVQLPEGGTVNQLRAYIITMLGIVFGFVFISWGVYEWMVKLEYGRRYERSFLLLAFYLIGIRAAMLYFNLPNALIEIELFDSKYYASSDITPSLGDLLLNVLVAGNLLLYGLRYFFRSKTYRWLVQSPRYVQVGVSLLLVGFSHWILYLHFYLLRTIYLHSQLTLDITFSFEFSFFKVVCLIIFILTSCIYFLTVHLLASLFIRMNREHPWPVWLLVGTVLFALGCLAMDMVDPTMDVFYPVVIAANFLYFLLVVAFRLPKSLLVFKYSTSIYLFAGAVVCAMVGAFAVYNLEQQKHLLNQQRFGEELKTENDYFGEYLLSDVAVNIEKDAFVRSRLLGPFASPEAIEQKIRRIHLHPYLLDKYDVGVHVFNAIGEPLTRMDQTQTYWEYVQNYRKVRYITDHDNLYFVNEIGSNASKQYLQFVTLVRNKVPIGYVVLDMKLKKAVANNNAYPELLVDRRFIRSPESRNYSYAIFEYGDLVFSEGSFNYPQKFDKSLLSRPEIMEEGVTMENYLHVAVQGERGKQIVVSALKFPIKNIFTNFSFLFLVLVLCAVVLIIVYVAQYSKAGVNTSFATKIQVYLNVAFFLPLFVVSVATISIISSAYRDNLGRSFIKKAESVSSNIRVYIDQYNAGKISYETLASELTQISRYSESDVNVFDETGRLTISSQPLIYDDGLLSRYINPQAFVRIVEQDEKRVMLAESVGRLHYNSVYVGIRSYDGNQLMGIVSIPFFESRAELNRQIIEVLSTIVNIFTAIFICFLVFSYFASRILTVPLRLITGKIQKTTLHGYNEPLEWDSDDEIGLLVGEYNRMLVKLEESKRALSQSEKESAWREMAQQVAHEIKNPLTPMKLTLQHLQRTLRREDEEIGQLTERSFNTLLDQVDTLSDIATSFSAFAKMPIPKEEVFEISIILKKTVDLYRNNEEVEFTVSVPPGEYYVKGDEQLMSRIFTNLILNGIQSVPNQRTPEIYVGLQKCENTIRVEIRDNGIGIADAIQHKIFLPNFSTKYSGSGIGLAVAKRGVEHAGGRIWFETEEGVGTSFFIELPVNEPSPKRSYQHV